MNEWRTVIGSAIIRLGVWVLTPQARQFLVREIVRNVEEQRR